MITQTLTADSTVSPLGTASFTDSKPILGKATSVFLIGLADSQRLREPNLDGAAAQLGWSFIARANDAGIPPTTAQSVYSAWPDFRAQVGQYDISFKGLISSGNTGPFKGGTIACQNDAGHALQIRFTEGSPEITLNERDMTRGIGADARNAIAHKMLSLAEEFALTVQIDSPKEIQRRELQPLVDLIKSF